MKHILSILAISFLLTSCGDLTGNTLKDEHEGHNHEALEEVVEDTIPLNNGNKWTADEATGRNVQELIAITNQFKEIQKPTEPDYKQLHADLARGLNKMIQQCTMKGPDHDALHVWLEPLLQDNVNLKDAATNEESEKIFHSIDKRLHNYQNYFDNK